MSTILGQALLEIDLDASLGDKKIADFERKSIQSAGKIEAAFKKLGELGNIFGEQNTKGLEEAAQRAGKAAQQAAQATVKAAKEIGDANTKAAQDAGDSSEKASGRAKKAAADTTKATKEELAAQAAFNKIYNQAVAEDAVQSNRIANARRIAENKKYAADAIALEAKIAAESLALQQKAIQEAEAAKARAAALQDKAINQQVFGSSVNPSQIFLAQAQAATAAKSASVEAQKKLDAELLTTEIKNAELLANVKNQFSQNRLRQAQALLDAEVAAEKAAAQKVLAERKAIADQAISLARQQATLEREFKSGFGKPAQQEVRDYTSAMLRLHEAANALKPGLEADSKELLSLTATTKAARIAIDQAEEGTARLGLSAKVAGSLIKAGLHNAIFLLPPDLQLLGVALSTLSADILPKAASAANGTARAFETLKLAGVVAAVGLTAIGVVGVAASIKSAADLEQRMQGVSSVLKLTADETRGLSSALAQINTGENGLPVTSTQLTAVARSAALMGVEGVANVVKFSDTIAKLGIVTRENNKDIQDLGQLSESVAKFLNETGVSAADYTKSLEGVASALAIVDQTTPGTIAQTLELSTYMAAGATTLNLSRESIIGIAGALSGLGAKAEAGGSALIRVLTNIKESAALAFGDFSEHTANTAENVAYFRNIVNSGGAQLAQLVNYLGTAGKAFAANILSVQGADGAMRNLFARVQAAKGEFAQFAEVTGLSTETLRDMVSLHPEESLIALSGGLSKILAGAKGSKEETKRLTDAFAGLNAQNIRDLRLLDQLIVGNPLLAKALKAAGEASKNKGLLDERAEIATRNLNDAVKVFGETLNRTAQVGGAPFLKFLTDIVRTATLALEKLNGIIDAKGRLIASDAKGAETSGTKTTTKDFSDYDTLIKKKAELEKKLTDLGKDTGGDSGLATKLKNDLVSYKNTLASYGDQVEKYKKLVNDIRSARSVLADDRGTKGTPEATIKADEAKVRALESQLKTLQAQDPAYKNIASTLALIDSTQAKIDKNNAAPKNQKAYEETQKALDGVNARLEKLNEIPVVRKIGEINDHIARLKGEIQGLEKTLAKLSEGNGANTNKNAIEATSKNIQGLKDQVSDLRTQAKGANDELNAIGAANGTLPQYGPPVPASVAGKPPAKAEQSTDELSKKARELVLAFNAAAKARADFADKNDGRIDGKLQDAYVLSKAKVDDFAKSSIRAGEAVDAVSKALDAQNSKLKDQVPTYAEIKKYYKELYDLELELARLKKSIEKSAALGNPASDAQSERQIELQRKIDKIKKDGGKAAQDADSIAASNANTYISAEEKRAKAIEDTSKKLKDFIATRQAEGAQTPEQTKKHTEELNKLIIELKSAQGNLTKFTIGQIDLAKNLITSNSLLETHAQKIQKVINTYKLTSAGADDLTKKLNAQLALPKVQQDPEYIKALQDRIAALSDASVQSNDTIFKSIEQRLIDENQAIIDNYEQRKSEAKGNLGELLTIEEKYGQDVLNAKIKKAEAESALRQKAINDEIDARKKANLAANPNAKAIKDPITGRASLEPGVDQNPTLTKTLEAERVNRITAEGKRLEAEKLQIRKDSDAALLAAQDAFYGASEERQNKYTLERLQNAQDAAESELQAAKDALAEELSNEELNAAQKQQIILRAQPAILAAEVRFLAARRSAKIEAENQSYETEKANLEANQLDTEALTEAHNGRLTQIQTDYETDLSKFTLSQTRERNAAIRAADKEFQAQYGADQKAAIEKRVAATNGESGAERDALRKTLEFALEKEKGQTKANDETVKNLEENLAKIDALDKKYFASFIDGLKSFSSQVTSISEDLARLSLSARDAAIAAAAAPYDKIISDLEVQKAKLTADFNTLSVKGQADDFAPGSRSGQTNRQVYEAALAQANTIEQAALDAKAAATVKATELQNQKDALDKKNAAAAEFLASDGGAAAKTKYQQALIDYRGFLASRLNLYKDDLNEQTRILNLYTDAASAVIKNGDASPNNTGNASPTDNTPRGTGNSAQVTQLLGISIGIRDNANATAEQLQITSDAIGNVLKQISDGTLSATKETIANLTAIQTKLQENIKLLKGQSGFVSPDTKGSSLIGRFTDKGVASTLSNIDAINADPEAALGQVGSTLKDVEELLGKIRKGDVVASKEQITFLEQQQTLLQKRYDTMVQIQDLNKQPQYLGFTPPKGSSVSSDFLKAEGSAISLLNDSSNKATFNIDKLKDGLKDLNELLAKAKLGETNLSANEITILEGQVAKLEARLKVVTDAADKAKANPTPGFDAAGKFGKTTSPAIVDATTEAFTVLTKDTPKLGEVKDALRDVGLALQDINITPDQKAALEDYQKRLQSLEKILTARPEGSNDLAAALADLTTIQSDYNAEINAANGDLNAIDAAENKRIERLTALQDRLNGLVGKFEEGSDQAKALEAAINLVIDATDRATDSVGAYNNATTKPLDGRKPPTDEEIQAAADAADAAQAAADDAALAASDSVATPGETGAKNQVDQITANADNNKTAAAEAEKKLIADTTDALSKQKDKLDLGLISQEEYNKSVDDSVAALTKKRDADKALGYDTAALDIAIAKLTQTQAENAAKLITDGIESVKKFAGALRDLAKAASDSRAGLGGLGGGISSFGSALAPLLDKLTGGDKGVGNTVAGIADAVGGVVGAFEKDKDGKPIKKTGEAIAGIAQGLAPIGDAIGSAIGVPFLGQIVSAVGSAVGFIIDEVAPAIVDLFDPAGASLRKLEKQAQEMLDGISQSLEGSLTSSIINAFKNGTEASYDVLSSIGEILFTQIINAFVKGALYEDILKAPLLKFEKAVASGDKGAQAEAAGELAKAGADANAIFQSALPDLQNIGEILGVSGSAKDTSKTTNNATVVPINAQVAVGADFKLAIDGFRIGADIIRSAGSDMKEAGTNQLAASFKMMQAAEMFLQGASNTSALRYGG